MASRQHLVPTPTVDRNGKVTTVYRKLSPAQKGAPLPGPAPVAGRDKHWRKYAVNTLVDYLSPSLYNVEHREDLKQSLSAYSDELLEMLVGDGTGLNHTDPDASPTAAVVMSDLNSGRPENEIREGLCFYPHIKEAAATAAAARQMVDSLHDYPQLPTTGDLSAEGEVVREQCIALLKVMCACWRSGSTGHFRVDGMSFALVDDNLVGFVMEHPDKGDLIAGVITERGVADVKVLAEMIDSESPSLSGGTL